jgi:uncharacterized Zn finger protein (UPF0148 family)
MKNKKLVKKMDEVARNLALDGWPSEAEQLALAAEKLQNYDLTCRAADLLLEVPDPIKRLRMFFKELGGGARCHICGAYVVNGQMNYCPHCGTPLEETTEESSPDGEETVSPTEDAPAAESHEGEQIMHDFIMTVLSGENNPTSTPSTTEPRMSKRDRVIAELGNLSSIRSSDHFILEAPEGWKQTGNSTAVGPDGVELKLFVIGLTGEDYSRLLRHFQ